MNCDDWSTDMDEFSEHDACNHSFNIESSSKIFKTKPLLEVSDYLLKCSRSKSWNIFTYSSETELLKPPSSKSIQPNFNAPDLNGYLKIQVSDTGKGIPEDKLPSMFGMFAQAHQSVGVMKGGTGLGLWISKQLCHKMGGDITVYSKVDQGTTFVFYLPVNNTDLKPQMSKPLTKKERVNALVVDDFAHNRDLHKLLLEREGAFVTTASDGLEAVKKFKEQPEGHYDFIMMDVRMPVMDGFAAAKVIRDWEEEQKKNKVDIYFVSGEYFNEEVVMNEFKLNGGIKDLTGIRCLRKPIDLEVVKRILDSRRGNE